MPEKKYKPEEIVAKLRQVDVLLSQGRSVGEACARFQIGYFRGWDEDCSFLTSLRTFLETGEAVDFEDLCEPVFRLVIV